MILHNVYRVDVKNEGTVHRPIYTDEDLKWHALRAL
jgi:hypothetical protein